MNTIELAEVDIQELIDQDFVDALRKHGYPVAAAFLITRDLTPGDASFQIMRADVLETKLSTREALRLILWMWATKVVARVRRAHPTR